MSRERTPALEILLTDCIEAESNIDGSAIVELDSALGIKLAQLLVEQEKFVGASELKSMKPKEEDDQSMSLREETK